MKNKMISLVATAAAGLFILSIGLVQPIKTEIADAGIYDDIVSVGDFWASGISADTLPFEFGEEQTMNSRIVTRNAINELADADLDKFFTLNMTLKIDEVPEGKVFAFAYGLESIIAPYGSDDSAGLWFTVSEEQVLCGFSVFGNGEESVMAESTVVGEIGKPIDIVFKVNTEGDISLNLSGIPVAAFDKPGVQAVRSGRVGLVQTGKCAVSVTDFSVEYFANARPDNFNALATFDDDNFDMNHWTAGATNRGGMELRQEIENGAFLYRNTQDAYFGTKQKYSNVAVEFEIPYIQRTPEYKDGKLLKTVSAGITVAIVADVQKTTAGAARYAVEFAPSGAGPEIPAEKTLLKLYQGGVEKLRLTLSDKFDLWSIANEGKTFGVSVRFIDGVLSTYLKTDGERGFTKLAELDCGKTSETGYVSIVGGWALATGWRGNFSIDNVSTFNLDLDGTAAGKVISAPVSIPHKPDDYPYEDSWDNDDLPFDGVID